MRLGLTDRYIKTLNPAAKRIEITDERCPSLVFRCAPTGRKTFTFDYFRDGKHKRISLGTYPNMGLDEARKAVAALVAKRDAGDDPRASQDRERAARVQAAMTFSAICDLYIENYAKIRKASWENDVGYLKRPRAKFRKRTAASITKAEIIGFLETVARTSKSSANRTQSVIRTMWGWAAEREYIPVNFLAGVRKIAGKEEGKDRVLTSAEIAAFLAALAEPHVKTTATVRLALMTILMTAQRPGEVAGMTLAELHDLGTPAPQWIIPRARTKNKKAEHAVPLSPTAARLIAEALAANKNETNDAADRPVFKSRFEGVESLARRSLSQAVRRIVADKGLAEFTPHDLRRTAATVAQSMRISRDAVKALLNHRDGDVTSIYARHDMLAEKREAVLAIESALLPLIPDINSDA